MQSMGLQRVGYDLATKQEAVCMFVSLITSRIGQLCGLRSIDCESQKRPYG